MKKVFLVLFVMMQCSNVIAMDVVKKPASFVDAITIVDSDNFKMHLSMAVGYTNKMIAENKLSDNNSIAFILERMSYNLENNGGNLVQMIRTHNLQELIEQYKEIDSNELVQFAQRQIARNGGNVKDAQEYLFKTRRILASLKLEKQYPCFSVAWMGELQGEDRINFIVRNANYPLDRAAIDAYMASFIYQNLIALSTNK